ncbi:uncharacterized protein Z520_03873 [Fonsecaea multimorphosa CBS 102226]|uniref:Mediator of RNA polymerase II transcription subunit 10 n=1 Tax=Fonsecaea multimorphosa CBS 102226 TaxID=1442371 RepID=A0A0D2K2W2_9EURO|nr:uncharacterized protein Z520_03873 [Fonsecaea multimorphosa CBS 102226]KIY00188.1 hypothetical protein Z520_03873 [Fonsecaea multimorphosa CBS 102226]OAL27383.1 hypothetical protein AYO22_03658 [Fonsecaea multimorphosa]
MAPYKASDPRRGAGPVARPSNAQMTDPQSPPRPPNFGKDQRARTPQGTGVASGAGTPISRAGRVGRFPNDRTQRVIRHQKTPYVYRIGIRLPKEKLRQFPRYNGTVRRFLYGSAGSFVTLKVPRLHTILISRRGQFPSTRGIGQIDTAVTAVPEAPFSPSSATALSGAPSIFSEVEQYSDVRTPATNEPSPQENWSNDGLRDEWKGAEQQLLSATGGSNIADGQNTPFPYHNTQLIASGSFDKSFGLSNPSGSDFEDRPVAERVLSNTNDDAMAPVKDTTNVHNTIKDIIQHLTDIQIQTHGYIPATQDLLVDKLTDLTNSLSQLKHLTSPTESPNNYIHQVAIAPEIVDYVDDGRNPDIFTRDFVENVQRGNAVVNGKQQAFREFTEVLAQKLKEGIPGVSKEVDRVLRNAGFDEQHDSTANGDEQMASQHEEANKNGPANG